MKLAGRTALVTGARGGIGPGIVAWFLREGATVYPADLSEPGSGAARDRDGSRFLRMDVASEEEVVAAMARVREDVGELRVLVNAAAVEIERTIEDTMLEEWNASFAAT